MFPLRDDRPTSTPPLITILIIVACALVFFHEISLDQFSRSDFVAKYGLIPARFSLETLITSMFVHGGWMHIIGNMLFLWAFGKSLEDAMGHARFFTFFILCGMAAGIVQTFFTLGSRIPMVGASGAIAGVMGAYLLKFPRAYIRTLVFVFVFVTTTDIRAWFLVIFWFLLQVFSAYGSIAQTQVSEGGTAFFAHIGGFLTGMLLVAVMGTRNRYLRHQESRW